MPSSRATSVRLPPGAPERVDQPVALAGVGGPGGRGIDNLRGKVLGAEDRLVATSGFKLGLRGNEANLEGRGVSPDVEVPTVPEAVWRGGDIQLQRTRQCLAGKG